MPIYEYECKKCGEISEALQKFSDPPLSRCEKCHGKMRKLISQSSFHLKGTGWYVTDYASKKGQNTSTTENASTSPGTGPGTESGSGSGSEKSSESKETKSSSEKTEKKSTPKKEKKSKE